MLKSFRRTKFKKESGDHTSDRRLLRVKVIKASGLKAIHGATSDPYAVIGLRDVAGREIKTETFNVKQKHKTVNPVWNEEFVFGLFT